MSMSSVTALDILILKFGLATPTKALLYILLNATLPITALLKEFNLPTYDSSFFTFSIDQNSNKLFNCRIFFVWILIHLLTVSISKPRKTRQVTGPCVLLSASEIPNS